MLPSSIDLREKIVKSLSTARIHIGDASVASGAKGGLGLSSTQYNAISAARKAVDDALKTLMSEKE